MKKDKRVDYSAPMLQEESVVTLVADYNAEADFGVLTDEQLRALDGGDGLTVTQALAVKRAPKRVAKSVKYGPKKTGGAKGKGAAPPAKGPPKKAPMKKQVMKKQPMPAKKMAQKQPMGPAKKGPKGAPKAPKATWKKQAAPAPKATWKQQGAPSQISPRGGRGNFGQLLAASQGQPTFKQPAVKQAPQGPSAMELARKREEEERRRREQEEADQRRKEQEEAERRRKEQ